MFARRKFSAAKNLLEYLGLETGRLHFSWISSAEAEKFAQTARKVAETVQKLGPADYLKKTELSGAA